MKFSRIVLVAAAAPLLVAAKPPVVLAPVSPWVVDYSANSCRLVRSFGTKDNPVSMTLEQSARYRPPSLLVIGKDLRFYDTKSYDMSITPLDKSLQKNGRPAKTVDGKGALFFTGVRFDEADVRMAPPVASTAVRQKSKEEVARKRAESDTQESQRLAAMTGIRIDTRDAPVELQTGHMTAAMAKVDECIDNLEKIWGFDPAVQKQIVWQATVDTYQFDFSNLPEKTMLGHEAHELSIRIKVDAAGKPSDCLIESNLKDDPLKAPVCEALMKMGFLPAETADGTKVPSYFATAFVFQPWR